MLQFSKEEHRGAGLILKAVLMWHGVKSPVEADAAQAGHAGQLSIG